MCSAIDAKGAPHNRPWRLTLGFAVTKVQSARPCRRRARDIRAMALMILAFALFLPTLVWGTADAKAQGISATLDVVPVSARYLEIEPDEYISSLRVSGKKGWHVLLLEVAIGNRTSSYMEFPPVQLYEERDQNDIFKLVTAEGYEYEGRFVYGLNAARCLPPSFYLCNYIAAYTDSVNGTNSAYLNKPTLLFLVPQAVEGYQFVYDNRDPVDLTPLLSSIESDYRIIQTNYPGYADLYTEAAGNWQMGFGSSGVLSIASVRSTSLGVTAEVLLTNGGGYDEVYQSGEFQIAVIDGNGVFYALNCDEYTVELPPKSQEKVEYHLRYLPECFSTTPMYLFVYNSRGGRDVLRLEPPGSAGYVNAAVTDVAKEAAKRVYELHRSESLYEAGVIEDFFVSGSKLYIVGDSGELEIFDMETKSTRTVAFKGECIGVLDGSILVFRGGPTYGQSSRLSMISAQGTETVIGEINTYDIPIDAIGDQGNIYVMEDWSRETATKFNAFTKEKQTIPLADAQSKRLVADERHIYQIGEDGIDVLTIDNGRYMHIPYELGSSMGTSYYPAYMSEDYILADIGSYDAWWMIFDKRTNQLYPSIFSDSMAGAPRFVGSTVYYISTSSPNPRVRRYDIDAQSVETLYIQEDIDQSYYYGIVSPIRLDGNYIYFCYKEKGEQFSIRRIPLP